MECLLVITTTETREEADRLARGAVELRLAACAQVVGPISSTYWWDEQVETATEFQCLLKTTAARFDELRDHLVTVHAYETPEIVAMPIVTGSPAYLEWVARETRPR